MIRYFTIQSGSNGNCGLIATDKVSFLIDAGVSGSKTEKILNTVGETCKNIKGILITHEHSDHIKGVSVLSKRFELPVYATEGTFRGMEDCCIPDKMKICLKAGDTFCEGDLEVSCFKVMHDANEPVAYTFYDGKARFSQVTDTGTVTEDMMDRIAGSKCLLIESNYDKDKLSFGKYPQSLKNRIAGQYGHLSNDDAAEIAVRSVKCGTDTVITPRDWLLKR